jgi:hypothetical protein
VPVTEPDLAMQWQCPSPFTTNTRPVPSRRSMFLPDLIPAPLQLDKPLSTMSGLELAAGVIAVVQVTGQAAVLINKIKTLWGEVRDAPEDILYLLEEVELTSLTLQSIEQQVQQSKVAGMACDPVLEAVLKHAQGAYQALQKVADLLDKEIQQSRGKSQRFVKSAKVLLKRPVLDLLKSRLESSLRLLVLSSQVQMK